MHTVTATRPIERAVATVWNTIDDFENRYRFHPDLEHSESMLVGPGGDLKTADAPSATVA